MKIVTSFLLLLLVCAGFALAGEQARDGRFIAYDDGTVLDTQTNLIWAARDNGVSITWGNAKSYCDNYRGGGWRMPTQDELAGLYDASKSQQAECDSSYRIHVATDLIHLTCFYPWASEDRDDDDGDGAVFGFLNGGRYWDPKLLSLDTRALPVRAVK